MIPENINSKDLFDQFLGIFRVKTAALKWALHTFDDLPEKEKSSKIAGLINTTVSLSKKLGSIANPLDRTRLVHRKIDDLNKDVDTSKIECGKGCANCCHWKVDVTSEEAEILAEYVKSNDIPLDKERLNALAEHNGEDEFWFKSPMEERACIFLSEGGVCQVYSARPASCRKVLVTSKNRYCKDPHNKKIRALISAEVEIMTSLGWSTSETSIDTMPKKLKKALEESNS